MSGGACDQTAPITLGQTLNGTLTATDCLVGDQRYRDKYSFSGVAGQQIVIAMNSTAVDALLLLRTATGQLIAADNDGGGGTNARIPFRTGSFTLPATGNYSIEAAANVILQTGVYSVSLTAGNVAPPTRALFDFDGDGKTNVSVFRPSSGAWYLLRSQLGFTGIQFGVGSDLSAAGDYDGDGKADVAVFRPSNGAWYLNRTTAGFTGVQFGVNGDQPAPGAFVP